MSDEPALDDVREVTSNTLSEWLLHAKIALHQARDRIDALNVFPVPDGDTGTNMYLTWESACKGIVPEGTVPEGFVPEGFVPGEVSVNLAEAANRIGRQVVLGARGNSGVIMSALIRDFMGSIATEPSSLARALKEGTAGAYAAVATPIEGTILTVARAGAERAEVLTSQGVGLLEVVRGAADAAYEALMETPMLLAQLRDAGVVDAGGSGLVVVLDSLVAVLTGESPKRPLFTSETLPPRVGAKSESSHPVGDGEHEFEVMFHVESESIDALRTSLERLGSSVMIAGVDNLWNVHVHVQERGIADALNQGIASGSISHVSVTPLSSLHGDQILGEHRESTRRSRVLVVVTHGQGVRDKLTEIGVACVPTPPRQQPSASELISVAQETFASEVVFLPSDRDAHGVAEIAASELSSLGVRAAVVPTRSITQSLSAIAVHDQFQDFDRDVVAMTRSAGATHYGAVTVATRDALTMAGECHVGDVLGLIDGDIAVVGSSVMEVSLLVLGRLLAPGAELLTVVSGDGCSSNQMLELNRWVRATYPLVDLETMNGGQPLWPLIFGVE